MAFNPNIGAFNQGATGMASLFEKRQKYKEEPANNTLKQMLTQAKIGNMMSSSQYRGALTRLASERAQLLPFQVKARLMQQERLAGEPSSELGKEIMDFQGIQSRFGPQSQLAQVFGAMLEGKLKGGGGIQMTVDPATGQPVVTIGGSGNEESPLASILAGNMPQSGGAAAGALGQASSIPAGSVVRPGGMKMSGAILMGSDGNLYQNLTSQNLTAAQARIIADQNVESGMKDLSKALDNYPYFGGSYALSEVDPKLIKSGLGSPTGADSRQKAAGDVETRVPLIVESLLKASGLPPTEGNINKLYQGMNIVPGASKEDVINRAKVQLDQLRKQASGNQSRLLGIPLATKSPEGSEESPNGSKGKQFTNAQIDAAASSQGVSRDAIISALIKKYGADGFNISG